MLSWWPVPRSWQAGTVALLGIVLVLDYSFPLFALSNFSIRGYETQAVYSTCPHAIATVIDSCVAGNSTKGGQSLEIDIIKGWYQCWVDIEQRSAQKPVLRILLPDTYERWLVPTIERFSELHGVPVHLNIQPIGQLLDIIINDSFQPPLNQHAVWLQTTLTTQHLADIGISVELSYLVGSTDSDLQWTDIYQLFRLQLASYRGQSVSIPLDGSTMYLMRRVDVFERMKLEVPTTWQSVLDYTVAYQAARSAAAAEDAATWRTGGGKAANAMHLPRVLPPYPICLPRGAACRRLTLLQAIWSTIAQTTGSQQGVHFDPVTLRPLLDTPAAEMAFRIMEKLLAAAAPFEPDEDCSHGSLGFARGQCALVLAVFVPQLRMFILPEFKSTVNMSLIRVTPVPGSDVVWVRGTVDGGVGGGSLETCTPTLCPLGTAYTTAEGGTVLVNHAPLSPGSNLAGAVNREVPLVAQYLAYELLTYLASLDRYSPDEPEPLLQTVAPVREQHVNLDTVSEWVQAGYDKDLMSTSMEYIWFTRQHPNRAWDLRMPYHMYYNDVLAALLAGIEDGTIMGQLHANLGAEAQTLSAARENGSAVGTASAAVPPANSATSPSGAPQRILRQQSSTTLGTVPRRVLLQESVLVPGPNAPEAVAVATVGKLSSPLSAPPPVPPSTAPRTLVSALQAGQLLLAAHYTREVYLSKYLASLAIMQDTSAPSLVDTAGTADPGKSHGNVVLVTALVVALAALMAAAGGGWVLWWHRQKLRSRGSARVWEMRHTSGRSGIFEPVALVVTDIQDSTTLWEALPAAVMSEAVNLHHSCVRRLLLNHGGYESTTEGDSFIMAFLTVKQAVAFALDLQAQLLLQPWPEQLLEQPACSVGRVNLPEGFPFSSRLVLPEQRSLRSLGARRYLSSKGLVNESASALSRPPSARVSRVGLLSMAMSLPSAGAGPRLGTTAAAGMLKWLPSMASFRKVSVSSSRLAEAEVAVVSTALLGEPAMSSRTGDAGSSGQTASYSVGSDGLNRTAEASRSISAGRGRSLNVCTTTSISGTAAAAGMMPGSRLGAAGRLSRTSRAASFTSTGSATFRHAHARSLSLRTLLAGRHSCSAWTAEGTAEMGLTCKNHQLSSGCGYAAEGDGMSHGSIGSGQITARPQPRDSTTYGDASCSGENTVMLLPLPRLPQLQQSPPVKLLSSQLRQRISWLKPASVGSFAAASSSAGRSDGPSPSIEQEPAKEEGAVETAHVLVPSDMDQTGFGIPLHVKSASFTAPPSVLLPTRAPQASWRGSTTTASAVSTSPPLSSAEATTPDGWTQRWTVPAPVSGAAADTLLHSDILQGSFLLPTQGASVQMEVKEHSQRCTLYWRAPQQQRPGSRKGEDLTVTGRNLPRPSAQGSGLPARNNHSMLLPTRTTSRQVGQTLEQRAQGIPSFEVVQEAAAGAEVFGGLKTRASLKLTTSAVLRASLDSADCKRKEDSPQTFDTDTCIVTDAKPRLWEGGPSLNLFPAVSSPGVDGSSVTFTKGDMDFETETRGGSTTSTVAAAVGMATDAQSSPPSVAQCQRDNSPGSNRLSRMEPCRTLAQLLSSVVPLATARCGGSAYAGCSQPSFPPATSAVSSWGQPSSPVVPSGPSLSSALQSTKSTLAAALMFRGLRVRVGISWVRPTASELQYNAAAARMVYGGPCLAACKCLTDIAHGSQVLMSKEAKEQLDAECGPGSGGRPNGTMILHMATYAVPGRHLSSQRTDGVGSSALAQCLRKPAAVTDFAATVTSEAHGVVSPSSPSKTSVIPATTTATSTATASSKGVVLGSTPPSAALTVSSGVFSTGLWQALWSTGPLAKMQSQSPPPLMPPQPPPAEQQCVYWVTSPSLSPRLALLPPLRLPVKAVPLYDVYNAPIGLVSYVAVQIPAVDVLLAWNQAVTEESLRVFQQVALEQLQRVSVYGIGYMAPCGGGPERGRMYAVFTTAAAAVHWAEGLRRELLSAPWPPELLLHELCEVVEATEATVDSRVHPRVLPTKRSLNAYMWARPAPGEADGRPEPLGLLPSMSSSLQHWWGIQPTARAAAVTTTGFSSTISGGCSAVDDCSMSTRRQAHGEVAASSGSNLAAVLMMRRLECRSRKHFSQKGVTPQAIASGLSGSELLEAAGGGSTRDFVQVVEGKRLPTLHRPHSNIGSLRQFTSSAAMPTFYSRVYSSSNGCESAAVGATPMSSAAGAAGAMDRKLACSGSEDVVRKSCSGLPGYPLSMDPSALSASGSCRDAPYDSHTDGSLCFPSPFLPPPHMATAINGSEIQTTSLLGPPRSAPSVASVSSQREVPRTMGKTQELRMGRRVGDGHVGYLPDSPYVSGEPQSLVSLTARNGSQQPLGSSFSATQRRIVDGTTVVIHEPHHQHHHQHKHEHQHELDVNGNGSSMGSGEYGDGDPPVELENSSIAAAVAPMVLLRGLRMRAGIATGPVEWGIQDHTHALAYHGRPVVAASKLVAAAASGQVLCDEATRSAAIAQQMWTSSLEEEEDAAAAVRGSGSDALQMGEKGETEIRVLLQQHLSEADTNTNADAEATEKQVAAGVRRKQLLAFTLLDVVSLRVRRKGLSRAYACGIFDQFTALPDGSSSRAIPSSAAAARRAA